LVNKPVIGLGLGEADAPSVQTALKLVKTGTLLALLLTVVIEALLAIFLASPFGWS
jgi:hypothetical protein